jgi:hypothetical protein
MLDQAPLSSLISGRVDLSIYEFSSFIRMKIDMKEIAQSSFVVYFYLAKRPIEYNQSLNDFTTKLFLSRIET